MAKYYRFNYSAGYVGTDKTAVFKFSDDATEEEVREAFDDWYENQSKEHGDFEEISEEEAEDEGIDEDLED